MVLNPAFVNQMFKPSVRTSVNMGRMTSAQIRAEYTKQSKVANKRLNAIQKAGLYSPAVNNLNQHGITRFGIKNQGLVTDADIKKAYRELMDFMNSATSSRTGIKETLDKMSKNFNMKFNGNYVEFSNKSKKLFDLYEDLREMSKKGELQTSDKYDIVHDLDTLYEAGIINDDTPPAELTEILNKMVEDRRVQVNAQYSQLHFNWRV